MILHPPSTRRAGASSLLAGLVLAVALAACGGASATGDGVVSLASPSPAPGASGGPAASVDPEEAMAAFTACMKEHGVEVGIAVAAEDGVTGVTGTTGTIGGPPLAGPGSGTALDPQEGTATQLDPKAMEAADAACRDLLPSGMLGDPSATIPPEQVEAMLGFAKCMREHGIDFPDPQFSGGGMSIQIGGEAGDDAQAADPMGEAFQAAQEACGSALPGGVPFVVGGSSVEAQP